MTQGLFFAQRVKKASAEGQSPLQDLKEDPRSGLYLLWRYEYVSWFSSVLLWKEWELLGGQDIAWDISPIEEQICGCKFKSTSTQPTLPELDRFLIKL